MKDRIPLYPGRVELTPVPGQPNKYDMVRADEPIEPGTPLNKATLLTDATAESLGLDPGDDPTVDDALYMAAGRVGDVKVTARTDLSDDWLLCDGDAFDPLEYSELPDLVGFPRPSGRWMKNDQGIAVKINAVKHGGGYWVAVGKGGNLYYTNGDPSGAWTSNKQGTADLLCVEYDDGYWAAVGVNTAIYKSGAPSGSWTSNKPGITATFNSIKASGYYWTTVTSNGRVCYVGPGPSGSWIAIPDSFDSSNLVEIAKSGANYWATITPGSRKMFYTTSASPGSGNWSNVTLSATSMPTPNSIHANEDNEWMVVGNGGKILFGKSADTASAGLNNAIQLGTTDLTRCFYSDGYWVVVDKLGNIFSSQDPLKEWHNSGQWTDVVQLNGIGYGNNQWVAVGDSGTIYVTPRYQLPAMTFDGAYAYIRGR